LLEQRLVTLLVSILTTRKQTLSTVVEWKYVNTVMDRLIITLCQKEHQDGAKNSKKNLYSMQTVMFKFGLHLVCQLGRITIWIWTQHIKTIWVTHYFVQR